MTTTDQRHEVTYRYAFYIDPIDENDDMRQRDTAAHVAQVWAAGRGYSSIDIISINRGRKNLVVRMAAQR